MSNYTPDPALTRVRDAMREANHQARQRIAGLNDDELRAFAYDRHQPPTARMQAVGRLLESLPTPRSREEAWKLLEPLLDDPDAALRAFAVRHCPSEFDESRRRLRDQLLSGDAEVRRRATYALAKAGDGSLLPALTVALDHVDPDERLAAAASLGALGTPAALDRLAAAFENRQGLEDRLSLAIHLLRAGDPRGVPALQSAAEEAASAWAVAAATAIWAHHNRAEGLRGMRHILDSGPLSVQRQMVNQLAALTYLPHSDTADGLAEARLWIEQQLAEVDPD